MARQWQFDWRLLVFTGFFLPVLIGLGIWQLNRAEQKAAMLEAWQGQGDDQTWAELAGGEMRSGKPVTITGWYGEQTWLLDNRTREGIAGYEVLTVFIPMDGPAVVVNRGWVRAPRTRDRLPAMTTPEELVSLEGRLAPYPEPPLLAEPEPAIGPWPRRIQTLPPDIAGREIAAPPRMIVQLSDSRQPGAFRADRSPDLMGPQTHYGYAAQWFALAAVLTILTVLASYRRNSNRYG